MVERIFDPRVLDTASGRFTLYVDVPERYNLPLNPDGTKPQITVAVDAENLGLAATGIKTLGAEHEMLAEGILSTAADRLAEGDLVENTPEYADLYHAIHDGDETFDTDSPVFHQFEQFLKQYTGWETTGVGFNFIIDDQKHEIEFTITAPGYIAALSAMQRVTTNPDILNSIIANAMPTMAEYDDYEAYDDYDGDDYDEEEDY